ncbi:MAG: hypothetical protein KC910_02775 [Candidatus Eremiobacteraeota bacterium]|nr:hypothetical protein [Candidatus Eremiobacteraeota bacterium]
MIHSKQDIVARYHAIKTGIQQAASEHPEQISVQGDRYEVTTDLSLPEGHIKAGSFFDNDLATRDKVTVSQGGETQTFEHFSEKRGFWPVRWTVERMQFDQAVQQAGGFSNSSTTFDV